MSNNMCNICPFGFYSLRESASVCESCPRNSLCPGGDAIRVNKGFWRSSTDSITIHECFNEEACLGDDGSTDEPYQCADNYEGNLCAKCKSSGDKVF